MSSNTISILGCGWLGLPLGQALIQKGFSVKGSTTRTERLSVLTAAGIDAYQIQAEQGSWKGERMQDFLICDTLIVAIPPGTRKNSNSTHAIEIEKFIKIMEEQNSVIRRILYISSTSVYKNSNRSIQEEDIRAVTDAENIILAQAEWAVQHSIIPNKLIVRLGGLAGYNRMLARFFAGRKDIAGGNEPVNLVHRDDAVEAIIHVMQSPVENTVYNICSPIHPEKRIFYTELCKRFELALPDFPRSLNGEWKCISTEKIEKTGYVFKFPNPDNYTYSRD